MKNKKLHTLLSEVHKWQKRFRRLDNLLLARKTVDFKERLSQGEELEDFLPEAFAVVCEAARRVLNMNPFRVQVLGGIILFKGCIAEIKTGQGKTLVAALPSYLEALSGKGVHVVTVNDYLARRDAEQIGRIHEFLGLTVGAVIHESTTEERRNAYACDITYVTNSELGFDFLRDQMVLDKREKVLRGLNYAIIDEVDSILIDEARTPLIISQKGKDDSDLYLQCDKIVRHLLEEDYAVDEIKKTVSLTEAGIKRIEKLENVDNLMESKNLLLLHGIQKALSAHFIMRKNKDYIIRNGEVQIVDSFTGRIMEGRRFSEGLHQAIEAKENVHIKAESKQLATITYQHFFNKYKKKAGMTGTAISAKKEFRDIYHLEVIQVPTNKPVERKDLPDRVFRNQRDKYTAVINTVRNAYINGQPVLIGTDSVKSSEYLHRMFVKKGIPHQVLNAKRHDKEAQLISRAGLEGAVTIATNMAGRGTDIKLSSSSKSLGGLMVIGTDHHESRRIDDQLRGRSGRQGDPGVSQYYVSLEDDLIRFYGDEPLKAINHIKKNNNSEITSNHIRKSFERAQKRIENEHFEIRKNVFEYDEILDDQRVLIYREREEILNADDLEQKLLQIIYEVIHNLIIQNYHDYRGLRLKMRSIFGNQIVLHEGKLSKMETEKEFLEAALNRFRQIENRFEKTTFNSKIQQVMLRNIDHYWISHMDALDHLKEGIQLEAYGQRDPKVSYKKRAYELFDIMLQRIRIGIVSSLLS